MSASLIWLLVANPRNAATGAVQTVRLAGGGKRGYRQFGSVDYWAGLERPPAIVQSLGFADGVYGEGAVVQALQMRFGTTAARRAALTRLFWKGAPFTLYCGPDGGDDASFATILQGRFDDVSSDGSIITLAMADPSVDLARPVLAGATFAGTGGIEGVAELKGRFKRRAKGYCNNIELWSLEPANNIWVATDPSRPLFAIEVVRDKGNAASSLVQIAWQGSIAATLIALRAAVCPQGGGAVAPSIGCIKWWYANPGKLTCDIRGETGAGFVASAPDIAEWLVSAVNGPVFNGASLAAAKAIRPDDCGLLVEDDASAGALLTPLLAGVSMWWGLSAAGQISIGQWAFTAPASTLQGASVTRVRTHNPVAQARIGYRRNHTVMARGDIAAALFYEDGTSVDALQPSQPGATNNADLADANIVTIDEKIRTVSPKEAARDGSGGRYLTTRARMVALGLSVVALDNARADWLAYRNSIASWNNTTVASAIVRATWDLLDRAYDAALNAADVAISLEDSRRADYTYVIGAPMTLAQLDAPAAAAVTTNSGAIGGLNPPNSSFGYWKTGLPEKWGTYSGTENQYVTRRGGDAGGYAIEVSLPIGIDWELFQFPPAGSISPGNYVIEWDVERLSGNWSQAVVRFLYFDASNNQIGGDYVFLHSSPDVYGNVLGGTPPAGRYYFRKNVTVPAGTVRYYFGFSGPGFWGSGNTACTMRIFKCGFRVQDLPGNVASLIGGEAIRNTLLTAPGGPIDVAGQTANIGQVVGAGALAALNNLDLAGAGIIGTLPYGKAAAELKNDQITAAQANASNLMRLAGGGQYQGDLAATRNEGRGNYAAATVYYPGDFIAWPVAGGGNGSGYVRIGAGTTTATAPSDAAKWAKIVDAGTPGANGANGTNGVSVRRCYQRAATQPITPTGASFPPAGWSAAIPAANGNPAWSSDATVQADMVTVVSLFTAATQIEAVTPVAGDITVAQSGTIERALANGEQLSAQSAARIGAVTGGSATYTLQLKIRPIGGADVDFGVPSVENIAVNESATLLTNGTFTNTSGGPVRYQITAALTKTGAGNGAQIQSGSFLKA
jgi:hypothetical protein